MNRPIAKGNAVAIDNVRRDALSRRQGARLPPRTYLLHQVLVVQKAVEEHGGQLTFTSAEGSGTRFGAALPVPPRRRSSLASAPRPALDWSCQATPA